MDTTTVDRLARTLSRRITRRRALRGLVSGAVAAVAGGALLQAEDASAKRRRKKRRTGQNSTPTQGGGTQPQLLSPGSRCESSSQCTSQSICAVPVNGSNSDTSCSGATGAICGAPNGDGDDTAPYCAVGYSCVFASGSSTCQPVPDEIESARGGDSVSLVLSRARGGRQCRPPLPHCGRLPCRSALSIHGTRTMGHSPPARRRPCWNQRRTPPTGDRI